MSISQLLRFLTEATGYLQPDSEGVEEAGEDAAAAAGYHKYVVLTAIILGLLCAVVGTSLIAMGDSSRSDYLKMLLAAPLIFGAIGILLGVSIACAAAPTSFLEGPLGRKWMNLIGTQNVLVARLVCLMVPLAAVALPVAFTILSQPR